MTLDMRIDKHEVATQAPLLSERYDHAIPIFAGEDLGEDALIVGGR